jgi:uncharacterized protein YndB with AHSA1/START domain
MSIIKKTIGALIGIILLLLIVAIFVNKEYSVERKVTIQQPKNLVFNYIKFLKNQDEFSVWMQIDPNIKKEYIGTDGSVGFISSWNSEHKDVGRGEQEIVKIIEGERIEYELRFYEPWESTSPALMTTEIIDENTTLVRWSFYGKMNYPMNLLLLFMNMEEMIGSQLQEGLNSLKDILEN